MLDYHGSKLSSKLKSKSGWSLASFSSRIIRQVNEPSDNVSVGNGCNDQSDTLIRKKKKLRRRSSLPASLYKHGRPDVLINARTNSGFSLSSLDATLVDTSTDSTTTTLMPWTKRQLLAPDDSKISTEEFQYRREAREFSSLRSPAKKRDSPSSLSPSFTRARHCTYAQSKQCLVTKTNLENLRLTRASSERINRCSDNGGRKKISQDTFLSDEIIKANVNAKATLRGSKKCGNAPNFFIRYQDVLRKDRIMTIDQSETSCCEVDSSKFTQINEVFEYLLNLHCSKPVTKTCKQLFYIRSRLSKNARKNDSMCDGCFGCETGNERK